MKIFKYRFTKITHVFIYLGLALSVAAFGITLYNVLAGEYKSSPNMAYPIIGFVAMFAVSVLLFVILLSLLVSSYYSVGDKTLKTSFGIIKSKFSTDDMESIVLDRATNKLSVQFKTGSYILIAVKPEWYEDFINEILKCNPTIEYTINSVENSPDDQLKK